MTTFYKLDFNSILDSHLAAKNGNPGTPLTRDNGTAQSLPGTSINAYSFFATLFGTGIGHYSNMSTFHIIYNLNAAHYVFHYNQISNYSDNFLSGSFTSGRYCLIMQTGWEGTHFMIILKIITPLRIITMISPYHLDGEILYLL